MKKGILLFILVLTTGSLVWGQIAAWDFTGVGGTSLPTYPATTYDANLVSGSGESNITRGPTAPWSNANNSFRTTGFKNEGISISNTDYFQITLTASAGYSLSLSTIDARLAGTASYCASPGVSSQFAYSLDGSTFILIGSPQVTIGTPAILPQIDLTGISGLQNVNAGTTITLRYYASGQTATGGWGFYSASAGTNGLSVGGELFSISVFTGTGDWNQEGNWSNGIPTYSVSAVVEGFATIDIFSQARNLTVNPGKSVTISPAGSLTVTGLTILNSNESLILESDASRTGSFIDNGISGTGTTKVERYLTVDAWHYISSPISNATAGIFLDDYLMTSDPATSTGWTGWIIDPSSPLDVMRGYACWKPSSNPGLESFTGDLNTGNQAFTGTRTATDQWAGWHLAGNPYPCSINLTTGVTWDHFEATAYFWNGSNYLVYPVSAGFGTHSQFVPSGQGFYVHIDGSYEGSSTLTMTNMARIHIGETFLKDTLILKNALILKAFCSDNDDYDEISLHFDPGSTAGFDPGYDAYKLWGLNESPQLYTLAGDTNLSCNSMPYTGRNTAVQMGFRCGLPGMFTLIADSLGTFVDTIKVSLEDLKLQIIQDLRINPVYDFLYDTLDDPNRFILHFDNPTPGGIDPENLKPLQIYSFGPVVYIKSMDGRIPNGYVLIYDMTGKEVYRGKLALTSTTRITPGIADGCYVVKVVVNDCVFTDKINLSH